MTSVPLVSILIPCYNSASWLAETLDSALAQTWENTEVILVDDGSTDNSLAIAKDYESKGVKVFSQTENRGQTAALNRCLKLAKGDFVQYLDADDILEPQKIEVQIHHLLREASGTVATSPWARFYSDDLSTARFVPNDDWRDFNEPTAWLISCWTGHGTMPPGSWLYPRAIIEKVGYWHESLTLNNDMEYFTRVILACTKVVFCQEARWYYRSGHPSLSGQRSDRALRSQYEVIRLSTERLLDTENTSRTRYASACYWQYFIFLAYPQVPNLIQSAERKISALGGCDLKLDGGRMFKVFREVFGWRLALRIQKLFYRYRYGKII